VIATWGKYEGRVILQHEQNQGLDMLRTLTEAQRKKAILNFSKTGSNLTEAFKDNVVLDYAGLRAGGINGRERRQLVDLIELYVANMD